MWTATTTGTTTFRITKKLKERNNREIYYAWDGKPAHRLTFSEGLGENEWNVYVEEYNEETCDYEITDVGVFPSRNAAELSLEEQCDILEGQGFVRVSPSPQ